MPIYTAYTKIKKLGRHKHKVRNTAVLTFHTTPIDWYDLKNTIRDAARNIYNNFNQQTISQISIERHLSGRSIRAMQNYRDSKIRFKRQPEFKAKISYNPKKDEVKIESAIFITPQFYQFKADYDLERGKKWALKPLVEKEFQKRLLDPQSIRLNLFTAKNSVYDTPPTNIYEAPQTKHDQMGSYSRPIEGSYGLSEEVTVEIDESERENQIKG